MSRPLTLIERRHALDLTRRQLAALMGVDVQTIKRAEQERRLDGKPYRPRAWYALALEAIEARAAAGTLVVEDRRPAGRPRQPFSRRPARGA